MGDFFGCMLILFKIIFFKLSGILSECQTVLIRIRPNVLFSLYHQCANYVVSALQSEVIVARHFHGGVCRLTIDTIVALLTVSIPPQ